MPESTVTNGRQDAAAQDKPNAVAFWFIVAFMTEAAIAAGLWFCLHGKGLL